MAREAWGGLGIHLEGHEDSSGSSNAISSPQKVVKPVRGLLGAVRNMQRLVNAGKCLVAGVCSPTASEAL